LFRRTLLGLLEFNAFPMYDRSRWMALVAEAPF